MNAEILRQIAEDANQKGELGLFLWANWRPWEEIMSELKPGEERYDFALQNLKVSVSSTIKYKVSGFDLLAFFSVPIERMLTDEKFFKEVLTACENNKINGPVTYIPSRITSEFC